MLKSIVQNIPGVPWIYRAIVWCSRRRAFAYEFTAFKLASESRPKRFALRWRDRQAYLEDRTSTTGFDRHYVYHTAWAARVLARTRPAKHVDISSTLYFVGIASAFVPIDFYDYRPADLQLDGLTTGSADLLHLPFPDRSIASLSCMHVIEHIGLGRYGEPLDPDGDLKSLSELQRVLAPGGTLLIVVPVGRPRLVFNAHRVYAQGQIIAALPELQLFQFSLIPDDPAKGGLIREGAREIADSQEYACGCFWFRRPA